MATLDELINSMYDMVQDAKGIPLASEKCVIERDRLLDLLDDLRNTLPGDLKMAQDIVEKRNDMLAAGKREAEAIRRQAEEDARQMVSETELIVAARRKAKEIAGNAEIQSRELRRVANEYCEDTLKRTEEAVALSLEEVRKARQRFKSISK
ncbi:hypothetical protein [Butyricicoccus sp. Marseille-Q5471]|uniref:hypothetical protein n=1 Tax=Butyricicoccus sp. Marseille-Q5471 TaxID=3039493 RepID=UPI0024BCB38B|nr:hypothetical protein [Butyricicoccus sp. Marseille-Q5471]